MLSLVIFFYFVFISIPQTQNINSHFGTFFRPLKCEVSGPAPHRKENNELLHKSSSLGLSCAFVKLRTCNPLNGSENCLFVPAQQETRFF